MKFFSIREVCRTLTPVPSTVFYADGCNFRCDGCLYWQDRENMMAFDRTPEECAEIFLKSGTDCITLSGGNPLCQAEGFADMMDIIRRKKNPGLIIYCGETPSELAELGKKDPAVGRLAGMADIIVTGRYVPSLDRGEKYRGSCNQEVLFPTARYRRFSEAYGDTGRSVEIEIRSEDGKVSVGYSGVPSAEQRKFFSGLNDALSGKRSGSAGSIERFVISEDMVLLTSGGRTVATLRFVNSTIYILVNQLQPEEVQPLVNAAIRIMEGGE